MEKVPGERPKVRRILYTEFATSLVDLASLWLEDCSLKEDVPDKIAIEHYTNTKAPEDLRVWVRKHKPNTCSEAGYWADEFKFVRNDASLPFTGTSKSTKMLRRGTLNHPRDPARRPPREEQDTTATPPTSVLANPILSCS